MDENFPYLPGIEPALYPSKGGFFLSLTRCARQVGQSTSSNIFVGHCIHGIKSRLAKSTWFQTWLSRFRHGHQQAPIPVTKFYICIIYCPKLHKNRHGSLEGMPRLLVNACNLISTTPAKYFFCL